MKKAKNALLMILIVVIGFSFAGCATIGSKSESSLFENEYLAERARKDFNATREFVAASLKDLYEKVAVNKTTEEELRKYFSPDRPNVKRLEGQQAMNAWFGGSSPELVAATEKIKLWIFSEKIQTDKKSGKFLLMFGKRNVKSKSYEVAARFLMADGVVVAKDYSDEDKNTKSREDESIFNAAVPFGIGLLF